jgi:hypothetical protein
LKIDRKCNSSGYLCGAGLCMPICNKQDVSGQLQRPVVVAMISMRMMESSIHKVIDVVTVGDSFVSAVRTVYVV